ncbi:MAG: LysE family translocator [Methylobacterium sp.]|uniref:LysE family translocator n=1 Tax=Methylobacterium sp. TaxID=409 RepID=UPI0025E4CBA1|nr:LysE family translocator [Methylobacterium sp.]MBX9933770.1 LysE family translocator [Methylobacterium sp.]
MSTQNLVAFAVTCLLIEITPGPNMAYLAVLSAVSGRRAGLAATVGIALGLLAVGLASAFGLASLISTSPLAYEALRWGGVVYLLWLSWDGWRDAETSAAKADAPAGDAGYFARGLVTNLLNPKAAVFYVAVLLSFVTAGIAVLQQTVLLSAIYVAIATAIHSGIVVLAGAARPFLEDPSRSRVLRRTLSLVLAGIAVWFAYATAR